MKRSNFPAARCKEASHRRNRRLHKTKGEWISFNVASIYQAHVLTATLSSRQCETLAGTSDSTVRVRHVAARVRVTRQLSTSNVIVETALVSNRLVGSDRHSTGCTVETDRTALSTTAILGRIASARSEVFFVQISIRYPKRIGENSR